MQWTKSLQGAFLGPRGHFVWYFGIGALQPRCEYSSTKPINNFPWKGMIDLFESVVVPRDLIVWHGPGTWWDDTAGVVESRREGQPLCKDDDESKRGEKVAPGSGVDTRSVFLHTSVWEKPCLRKMQAGPTMLCSMLQFFTSAPKGSLNDFSSTSLPRRGPSVALFRGRSGC